MADYDLLSAIKNKWEMSPTDRQSQTRSNVALHKIIVGNKFEPPTNEKRIISYGVEPPEIKKLYTCFFSIPKNTK